MADTSFKSHFFLQGAQIVVDLGLSMNLAVFIRQPTTEGASFIPFFAVSVQNAMFINFPGCLMPLSK